MKANGRKYKVFYCSNCGEKFYKEAKFCHMCGGNKKSVVRPAKTHGVVIECRGK